MTDNITTDNTATDPPPSPPTLLTLPSSLQDHILSTVLTSPTSIRPLYRTGALLHGPWSSPTGTDVIALSNIPLSPLLICKSLSARSLRIFYSSNTFAFSSPTAAWDFLSRHLLQVHHLDLTLFSGYLYTGTCPTMEQPQERQWLQLFTSLLRHKRDLQSLVVTLHRWTSLQVYPLPRGQEGMDTEYVQQQRMNCVEAMKLLSARRVSVREQGARFMSVKQRHDLALLIQQRK
ncbi:MAG: hypothetical protein Q9160_001393 [Pyrenula sp. 1 TL-2023]